MALVGLHDFAVYCRSRAGATTIRDLQDLRVTGLGDEVRIGRGARMVEFDWDPTISAGAEMLDGSNLGARGKDLRLEELDPRTHRRSNAERRAQYHEMMDARAAVRDAMMAERKAGHWADPTVDDDRHDETSLFGHGESSEDGETEE